MGCLDARTDPTTLRRVSAFSGSVESENSPSTPKASERTRTNLERREKAKPTMLYVQPRTQRTWPVHQNETIYKESCETKLMKFRNLYKILNSLSWGLADYACGTKKNFSVERRYLGQHTKFYMHVIFSILCLFYYYVLYLFILLLFQYICLFYYYFYLFVHSIIYY